MTLHPAMIAQASLSGRQLQKVCIDNHRDGALPSAGAVWGCKEGKG